MNTVIAVVWGTLAGDRSLNGMTQSSVSFKCPESYLLQAIALLYSLMKYFGTSNEDKVIISRSTATPLEVTDAVTRLEQYITCP